MLSMGPATRIYVGVGATDMRKGFEGLYGLVCFTGDPARVKFEDVTDSDLHESMQNNYVAPLLLASMCALARMNPPLASRCRQPVTAMLSRS